jgi:cold shock CspA family protein
MVRGVVTEFSDEKGLGTVTSVDGRPYLFHVVEIADGSRTIDVGQSVCFQPLAKFGQLQAGAVHKV